MPWEDAPFDFTLRHLFIDIKGEEKTGKTHLALTAPGPIGVCDLNDGLNGVVQKRQREKPKGFIQTCHWPMPDGLTKDALRQAAETNWLGFAKDFRIGIAKKRSMIVDSGTEVWRLSRASEMGAMKSESKKGRLDYEACNSKIRGLLRLYHAHKANVILTHQLEDNWVEYTKSDGTKGNRTSGRRRDGFNEIPFMVQVGLTTGKRILPPPDSGLEFFATLDICRFDPGLEGAEFAGDLCNLPYIMSFVTGTDEELWK